MVAWRRVQSLPISERALALARSVRAGEAEVRALTVRAKRPRLPRPRRRGSRCFRQALQLAERSAIVSAWNAPTSNFSDALMMLGRPRESARLAETGLEGMRGYGSAVLVANQIEALLAIGTGTRQTSAAPPPSAASPPASRWLLTIRADLEIGRGGFRCRAGAPRGRARHPARGPRVGHLRHLPGRAGPVGAPLDRRGRRPARRTGVDALPRDRADTRQAVRQGTARRRQLAALSRARRDAGAALDDRLGRRRLMTVARSAAAEASRVTPNAAGWLALAEAEYPRARGEARPEAWADAATRAAARASAPRRLLPLAPSRGASHGRCIPYRGERAAAGGARRRIGANPLLRELVEQARASIRKLAALNPSVAWSGHANPVTGDVAEQLERAAAAPL